LSLISRFTTSEGLPNNLVTAVYVDETEAWVGTSGGGVARYLFAEKNWIITGEAEGLISNFVTDVVKFKGRVFVGTKQGISVWDGFAWTSMTEQERVQLLNTTFRVRNGELWVAARNMRGGLLAFDGEKWKDKSTIRTGIVLNNVSTFDFDGNDIWIGTTSRGVYALRGNDWKIYSVTEGITSNFVYTMAVKGGRAYLGGCCGVSYFDGTRWTVYDVPEGLPHSTVNAIAWDGDVVWFGSKNGLAAFDGNEFRNFYAEDGLLAENHVTCLFVRGDELWVGTTGGLSRLKKIY
jgi:ligand-binding sensor domain-containing protein